MIIGIILISMLAIGLLALILPASATDWIPDGGAWVIIICLFIGGGGTIALMGTIATERSKGGYELHYQEWDSRYRGLSARITLWENGAEDPNLWDEVKKYNSDLTDAQYLADNKWTNWWNEYACNEFNIIEDIPSVNDIPVDIRNKEEKNENEV